MKRVCSGLMAGLLVAGMAVAEEDVGLAVVEEALKRPVLEGAEMLTYEAVTRMVEQADVAADRAFLEVKSERELRQLQQKIRKEWLNSFGGFPKRTPLNPQVTGVVQRDGYVIEKVLFESQPQHYVTAHLFLPDAAARGGGRVPGVAISCGHSGGGKSLDGYQRGAVLAAKGGLAALIYDPIDQGERWQILGKGQQRGTGGHNLTGVSAMLLGWNTARFRIWDGVRALDYLQSRKEVDPQRLGVMGNSGGGTLSSYIMAIDDRIMSAAPACYLSTLTDVCDNCGPQDAEQNFFGQLAFGLNHTGYVMARAPSPVAINCAYGDFFPFVGTTKLYATVGAVYARFGWDERVTMIDIAGPHGWKEGMRIGSVAWMRRWLMGDKGALPLDMPRLREMSAEFKSEEADCGLKVPEALVVEGGQVQEIAGARSVYDIMRSELESIERVRKPLSEKNRAGVVSKVAGIRSLPEIAYRQVHVGSTNLVGVSGERHYLDLLNGVKVPTVMLIPAESKGRPVLIVGVDGKAGYAVEAHGWLKAGHPVMVADITGMGEIGGHKHKFYGSANLDEGVGQMLYLLGKSLVAMRAEDIMVCAKVLSERCENQSVVVQAGKGAVVSAYHAYAVAPEYFESIKVATEMPMSWSEVVRSSNRFSFSDCVQGALRSYDWVELYGAGR